MRLFVLFAFIALTPLAISVLRLTEITTILPAILDTSDVPLWLLTLHAVLSVAFMLICIVQIVPTLRMRLRKHHQTLGKWAISVGTVGAVSGLVATALHPAVSGPILYWGRLAAGVFWLWAMYKAVVAMQARDFTRHGDWMARAFAITLPTGTLPFILLPFIAVFGQGHLVLEELIQVLAWPLHIWLIDRWRGNRPPRTAVA